MSPLLTVIEIIWFIIITISNCYHQCIHDKIPHSIINAYDNINNINNTRRKLSEYEYEYESIRIRPYWDYLESSTEISKQRVESIKYLVSAAIIYFESIIKVIRNNEILYYPKENQYGKEIKCGSVEIPRNHLKGNGGLINSDLILYISSSMLHCGNTDAIAWSTICVQNEENGRPIFGNINFCPYNKYNNSIGNEWKHDIMITIHEITHILGFSNILYSSFIDSKGNEVGIDNVIASNIKSLNGTIINEWIITPKVVEISKIYFNCTDIIGAPLEDDDSNIISSHWEQHFLNGDYMMAFPDKKMSYISKFTLGLLQDTGWYLIDFNYTEPQFQFGKNYGCKFFQTQCFNITNSKNNSKSNFNEYFCNPNIMKGEYCTFDHLSIGFCNVGSFYYQIPSNQNYKYFGNNPNNYYGFISSEYCPYIDLFDSNISEFNYQCFDLNGNNFDYFSSNYVPWNYSLSSRCINTKTKWEESAFCFPIICNEYDIKLKKWNYIDIIIGDTNIICSRNDTFNIKNIVNNNISYSITCPNIDTICINKYPFECQYGAWNDELNKCLCKPGFFGQKCQQKLDNIIIPSVQENNNTETTIIETTMIETTTTTTTTMMENTAKIIQTNNDIIIVIVIGAIVIIIIVIIIVISIYCYHKKYRDKLNKELILASND